MYPKVKKEHKEHGQLMKAFRKHFKKDESEMEEEMEDDDDEQVKPMTLYQKRKDRKIALNKGYDDDLEPHSDVYSSDGESTDEDRMYGENDESNDEGYDSVSPEDDDEYEKDQKEEMEEDSQPMLPKAQRKRMSIAVLTKKMSKPKKNKGVDFN